jgi:hypothetical protein
MYLYWIHKNLYHGYKNLSVAAMKKQYFAICIKQFADVTAHVHSADAAVNMTVARHPTEPHPSLLMGF